MMDRELPALMSAPERESYCRWLERLAGKKRGPHPDRLRQAAQQLRNGGYV